MSRGLSAERRRILMQLLRGEVTPDGAAREMGVSRRRVMDLRRRYLRSKLPRLDGVRNAPLDAPVRVLRDRWGVTHVSANSLGDCYVALGYAMAQDRLWHLDYMRRLARGRLAEVLGPGYLMSDRLHRTVGLSQAAEGAEAALDPEGELVVVSLAAGINAWMEDGDCPLPVEFDLLGYRPEPWTVRDTIAVWKWRWWMLTGRLGVISMGEAARRYLPPHLLDVFLSVEAGEETIVPSDEPAGVGGYDTGEGSNNWVVGGRRTAGGKPILATDPHNPVWHPSQWYQAQLTAPGMDAIGAIFVGTPGIYLGHTRKTAWGVTNHTASPRDLYRETVAQDNPELYREGSGWRRFEVEDQEVPVRGQKADVLRVRRTVRGPVVNEFVPPIGSEPDPPLSLSWVGAEPTTGFEAMLGLHRSESVGDVLEALKKWPFPILNMVFADADGRIGYHAVGRVPRRRAIWYGYRPAGDPAHAWDGMYAFEDLPHLIDPDRGWLATANNPPWGGQGRYVSLGAWSDGYRLRRIRERIEARSDHSLESVAKIHADVVHARARELAPVAARFALESGDRRLRRIGALLRDWDGAFDVQAVAPSVFSAFWEQWLRTVARARFPEDVVPLVAGRCGSVARRLLLGEDPGWLPEGADVSQLVCEALSEALAWLRQKVGSRRSQWRWGRLHRVTFAHPASENAALAGLLNLGPFETSGGSGTVRAAGFSTSTPFRVTGLSSYRMAVDLADPAHGLAVTTGGQSGHPASPHYGDHAPLWLADEYHPLLMDTADVEANLEGELVLRPEEV